MIKSIPLTKLVQSPRNVRRHGDPAADSELKASIAAHGLLQNLIVRPAARGKFEVEAGERRRCALLALAEEKILPKGYEVTCLVLEDDAEIAVETSLAENFHRLAMNPADEAQAFAALIDAGATTENVARRFGLTVRFVEGRLRLATLSPVVFDALASGEITLDLAKAFGATSDQEIQARVFGLLCAQRRQYPAHGAVRHGSRQRCSGPSCRSRRLYRCRWPNRTRTLRRR